MITLQQRITSTLVLPALLFCQPLMAAIEYVAEISRPAVGFPSNFIYWDVNNPVIGPAGHVAFMGSADTSTQSTANNTPAIWTGLGSDVSLIIKQDDSISGLPANVLFKEAAGVGSAGGSLNVTKSGHLGYIARLKGAVVSNLTDSAIVAYVNGENKIVLRAGDQAPGFPAGTTFSGINARFAFTDAGMLVTGSTSSFQQAVWFWDFNTVQLIAASNQDVGTSYAGCTFGLMSGSAFNDSGKAVLQASLSGSGCPLGAILKWQNGVWSKVVDSNDAVPGMVDTTFALLNIPFTLRINNAGDVTFITGIRQTSNFVTRNSIWVARDNGNLQLVSISNESLPGNSGQQFISGFFTDLGLSANNAATTFLGVSQQGLTSFNSILAGFPRSTQPYSGLPVSGESQLTVLAQTNQHPPGFPNSYFFEFLGDPSIAGDGTIGFSAIVADANDVFSTRKNTLWRGNNEVGVTLLVEPGMSVDVNGVTETLNFLFDMNISLGGNGESSQSGFASQMSDSGQIIFQGSTLGDFRNGIFLTDALDGGNGNGTDSMQIPMPTGMLLILAGALSLISVRYRAR